MHKLFTESPMLDKVQAPLDFLGLLATRNTPHVSILSFHHLFMEPLYWHQADLLAMFLGHWPHVHLSEHSPSPLNRRLGSLLFLIPWTCFFSLLSNPVSTHLFLGFIQCYIWFTISLTSGYISIINFHVFYYSVTMSSVLHVYCFLKETMEIFQGRNFTSLVNHKGG